MVLFYAMVLIINMNGISVMIQPQMNGIFDMMLKDPRVNKYVVLTDFIVLGRQLMCTFLRSHTRSFNLIVFQNLFH